MGGKKRFCVAECYKTMDPTGEKKANTSRMSSSTKKLEVGIRLTINDDDNTNADRGCGRRLCRRCRVSALSRS